MLRCNHHHPRLCGLEPIRSNFGKQQMWHLMNGIQASEETLFLTLIKTSIVALQGIDKRQLAQIFPARRSSIRSATTLPTTVIELPWKPSG